MEIITREQSGLREPVDRFDINLPTRELWLHHTAGNANQPIKEIQDAHMDDNGWWDIGYSFLINSTTLHVYEGRGAGIQGGHTEGHNVTSHGIAVLGNFNNINPSIELLLKIAELVKWGHTKGWWPITLTGGHRDTKATDCPGRHLYNQIPYINELAITRNFDIDDSNNKVDRGTATKLDRLVERVWDMEALSVITWAFSFYHQKTVSRETLNDYLYKARTIGIGETMTEIAELDTDA